MTTEQVALDMTQREFVEWQEYWRHEPFGLDSWQIAQHSAIVCAIHRGKRGKKFKTIDFMPHGTRDVKPKPATLVKGFHQLLSFMGIRKRET